MSTQSYVIEKLVNNEKDDVENSPQGQFMEKQHYPASTHLSASLHVLNNSSFLILSNESSIPLSGLCW